MLLSLGEIDGAVESWLVLVAHHIVTDAWSMALWITDLASVYSSYCRGALPPLAAPQFTYRDFLRIGSVAASRNRAGQVSSSIGERGWLVPHRLWGCPPTGHDLENSLLTDDDDLSLCRRNCRPP